jgi:hypothetical protein
MRESLTMNSLAEPLPTAWMREYSPQAWPSKPMSAGCQQRGGRSDYQWFA